MSLRVEEGFLLTAGAGNLSQAGAKSLAGALGLSITFAKQRP